MWRSYITYRTCCIAPDARKAGLMVSIGLSALPWNKGGIFVFFAPAALNNKGRLYPSVYNFIVTSRQTTSRTQNISTEKMHFHLIPALFASLVTLAAAQGCPITITVEDHGGCKGCPKTIDITTSTQLIDCGGCTDIATATNREPFYNCKIVCVGGLKTEYNENGTVTVTSCSVPAATAASTISAWEA